MHRSRKLALTALFASVLAACGGGGGDGTAAPASAPALGGIGTSSTNGDGVASGAGTTTASGSPAAAPAPSAGAPAPSPAASTPPASPPPPAPAAFSAFDPVQIASNPLPFGGAVARLSDGGNVVLWVAAGDTTRDSRLMAQRTDAAGQPVGAALVVKTEVERVTQVAVAAAPDGGYLVAWAGFDAVANTPGSVVVNLMARRYDADGTLVRETRLVPDSQYTIGDLSVEPMPGGGFVVGWDAVSVARTAPLWGHLQRLDADGALSGSEVDLLDTRDGQQQSKVTVVPHADGTVTAVWSNRSVESPQMFTIYTRRFDASLRPLTPPTPIDGTTQATSFFLSAAAVGSNVALAWSVPGSGSEPIRSVVIAPGATSLGDVATVTPTTAYQLSALKVESLGSGAYGVVWQESEFYPRGSNAYVRLQRHDASGAATGAPTTLDGRGVSWVSDTTGFGVTAGSGIAVDAGTDGHLVVEAQFAGKTEPELVLFGR